MGSTAGGQQAHWRDDARNVWRLPGSGSDFLMIRNYVSGSKFLNKKFLNIVVWCTRIMIPIMRTASPVDIIIATTIVSEVNVTSPFVSASSGRSPRKSALRRSRRLFGGPDA